MTLESVDRQSVERADDDQMSRATGEMRIEITVAGCK